jgi:2',3'-cyclic-nucleotide 2'-phosphodiesterase (5'-nucleotidase family)
MVARFLLTGDATAAPVESIVAESGVNLPPPPKRRTGRPFRLRVLHINDLHGRISHLEHPASPPVLSRVSGRLSELRLSSQDDPDSAVLMFSTGDELAGSVFDDTSNDDTPHPVYRLYSHMAVDAVALGNHDLDLGATRLATAIRNHAHFPVLAANLAPTPALAGLIHPAAILVVKGVRVGVVGITTPTQAMRVRDGPQSGPRLRVLNPVRTLLNLLPALRPLCDVVIVLSHLGLGLGASTANVGMAGDEELACALPRGVVHLIVGGHSHHALNLDCLEANNIVNGVPILQAGSLGRYLGEATISLNGAAVVTDARLTSVHELPLDETLERSAVQPLLAETRRLLQQPLGRVDYHCDLTTEAIRNDLALGESALANFICDAMVARCRSHGLTVDLAMVDSSVIRNGLPGSGVLTKGDWHAVMPYADTICLLQLAGRDLHQLLQDNARRVDRPDEPHTERGFLHWSGQVRYLIDPGSSRRSATAQMATINGSPLEWQPDRLYTVACPSFVRQLAAPWERQAAAELDLFPLALESLRVTDTGLFLRQELISTIEKGGGVTASRGAKRDGRVRVLWSTLVNLPHHTSAGSLRTP